MHIVCICVCVCIYIYIHTHTYMHDVDGNLHFISRLWTWYEPRSLSHPVGEFGFYLMILVLTCIYIYIYIYERRFTHQHFFSLFASRHTSSALKMKVSPSSLLVGGKVSLIIKMTLKKNFFNEQLTCLGY